MKIILAVFGIDFEFSIYFVGNDSKICPEITHIFGPSIHLINSSIYLFIYVFIYLSMYISMYLCICSAIHPSIYLSIYLCNNDNRFLNDSIEFTAIQE